MFNPITTDDLVTRLLTINPQDVKFLRLKTKTLVSPSDLLKTCKVDGTINPYYKQLSKISDRTYLPVLDYEKRVRNNRKKEGNEEVFVSQDITLFGKKKVSGCIYTDTETETKLYVMVEWFKNRPSKKNVYEFEGNTIEKVMFEKWLSNKEKKNKSQDLNNNVNVLTINIENILEVSMLGEKFEVLDELMVGV